ncbi:3-mercaptopyruvate sulfurtransferase [Haematobacter missouriensis]|uniref:3-mercaptopyruvate sulfurtransferase n=1 Tax=Haematobacter missouriensis TaxID=366616 RepID=A0A212ASR0_9RHOB|nr:3-mercaptopyruvate sulfurtransferase [Haematobacter missouriensis]OWJ84547.1 3-mercaptopyruvate sulfurtransferase [Haematobacter missouriensis]
MQDDPKTLVSVGWVAARLDDPALKLLDASWYMPADKRDPKAEFEAVHLPDARFFDIDAVSDPASPLPHMVPPAEDFAAALAGLGIRKDDQVVVYDGAGQFSAARVWWLFRHMGFDRIAVMDGGLPKWRAEGRPVESGPARVGSGNFQPHPATDLVRSAAEVLASVESGTPNIADARAGERFRGEVPEPRSGLRSGHIPGARNVPFKTLLNADGTMKEVEALRTIFATAGIDLDRPVITSCGSGVTAAVLSLALERIGNQGHALYDGSWTEWGGREDLPVEKG